MDKGVVIVVPICYNCVVYECVESNPPPLRCGDEDEGARVMFCVSGCVYKQVAEQIANVCFTLKL